MNLETIRKYCLKKKGKITEEFPFGEDVLVYKVNGKIFLLIRLNIHPLTMNLKCDPVRALELREQYESIQPGYHMNKKLWNTIVLDGTIPSKLILEMIDHSYDEVVKGLKTKERDRLLKE